jgi:hypothetical protein
MGHDKNSLEISNKIEIWFNKLKFNGFQVNFNYIK